MSHISAAGLLLGLPLLLLALLPLHLLRSHGAGGGRGVEGHQEYAGEEALEVNGQQILR